MIPSLRLNFCRDARFSACTLASALALSVGFAAPSAESRPQPTPEIRLSIADARADFDQLAAIVTDKHPKLFAHQAELAATIVSQRALLRNDMTTQELIRVLAPVSRATRCAHTWLNVPEARGDALADREQLLPFNVRVMGNRLLVVSSPACPGIPPGADILAINDRTSDKILELLLQRLPVEGENRSLADWCFNHSFASLYRLYVDDSREFAVTYAEPGVPGQRLVVLPAIDDGVLNPAVHDPSAKGPNHFSFESNYAVLTIASFNFYTDDERQRFQSFVKDFFAEARGRGVASLILDLRDNNGGDPYCAAALFSHLIERPAPYFSADSPFYPDLKQPQNPAPDRFSGRLFVLINGGCFSSTGHLCALLKYHRRGIFIGEETGGSYACTDASETTTLAHSKIRFRHSTLAFKAAVSGMTPGRGTLPDHTVVASIDDAVQERDPSMARAIELVQTPAATLLANASTTADLVSHP
jgi:hypothetical protein